MFSLFLVTFCIDIEDEHHGQYLFLLNEMLQYLGGCCACDRMVVGFITTCAISAYHHCSYEFEPHSWRGVLDTTLCDNVCQ